MALPGGEEVEADALPDKERRTLSVLGVSPGPRPRAPEHRHTLSDRRRKADGPHPEYCCCTDLRASGHSPDRSAERSRTSTPAEISTSTPTRAGRRIRDEDRCQHRNYGRVRAGRPLKARGEEDELMDVPHRVGVLVFDGVKMLDVAGPSEVFTEPIDSAPRTS